MKDSFSSAVTFDKEIEIEVQSYSGYRADEKPRAIFIAGKRYDVVLITDSYLTESPDDRTRRHYFHVTFSDASLICIYYDFEKNKWFLKGKAK
jgi:hypothetical protein